MFGYPLYVAFYQQNLTVLRDYVFITVSLKQILLGTVVEMAPLLFRSKERSNRHNSAEEWIRAMREEYDTAPTATSSWSIARCFWILASWSYFLNSASGL